MSQKMTVRESVRDFIQSGDDMWEKRNHCRLGERLDGSTRFIGNGGREEERNEHSRFPGLSELIDLQMGNTWREVDCWLKSEKVNKLVFGYVEFKIPLGHPRGHDDILKYIYQEYGKQSQDIAIHFGKVCRKVY